MVAPTSKIVREVEIGKLYRVRDSRVILFPKKFSAAQVGRPDRWALPGNVIKVTHALEVKALADQVAKLYPVDEAPEGAALRTSENHPPPFRAAMREYDRRQEGMNPDTAAEQLATGGDENVAARLEAQAAVDAAKLQLEEAQASVTTALEDEQAAEQAASASPEDETAKKALTAARGRLTKARNSVEAVEATVAEAEKAAAALEAE